MPLDMLAFKRFAYRSSQSMQTFDVSPGFIYITTQSEIHQYRRNCPTPISCTLPFKPLLTFLHVDTYFICSQKDLYYFKYTLNHIMPISPLTLNFEYRGFLVSICNDVVSTLKLEECGTEICHGGVGCKDASDDTKSAAATPAHAFQVTTRKLSSDNGICSAYSSIDSRLALGFENGVIGCIEDVVGESNSDRISLGILSITNEPIVSMCSNDEFIYASTIESIYRISCDGHGEDTGFFTRIQCKKIVIFKNLVILQQKMRIMFLDQNLRFVDTSMFQLEIKNLDVHQSSLFIGFICGLLIEYDLDDIIARLSKSHPSLQWHSRKANGEEADPGQIN